MSRIRVKSEIKVYEVNDQESAPGKDVVLHVESHWNRRELIILVIDGKRYTVCASDLEVAIKNATNTGVL